MKVEAYQVCLVVMYASLCLMVASFIFAAEAISQGGDVTAGGNWLGLGVGCSITAVITFALGLMILLRSTNKEGETST